MKISCFLSRFSPLLLAAPFLGGCMFLKPPDPEPVPDILKKPTKPIFNPTQFIPAGTALGKFEVTQIVAGDLLLVRSYVAAPPTPVPVKTPAKPAAPGATPTPLPAPTAAPAGDPVRLAGIVAPQKGQNGYEASIAGVSGWINANKGLLELDQDPKFPTDVENNRLVSAKFDADPRGEFKGQKLSLNRMMVRAGWAVVDMYSPTSFDTKDWLKDEVFARNNRRGLWGMGIAIQQRIPVRVAPPKPSGKGRNKLGNVKLQNPARPGTQTGGIAPSTTAVKSTTVKSTVKTTTETTTTAPAAAPAAP